MNSANFPLVSIGVPVYNGADKIEKALNSLLLQTYTNIEVVISDNASTDETGEICKRISNLDQRVQYMRQPINMGPAVNFKTVLDQAKGDYFMWLGHDDWLSESYIEDCMSILVKNPDVSIVCGQAVYYIDDFEQYKGNVVQLLQESSQERVIAYYSVVADNGVFYGLMRRDWLRKIRFINVMGSDWLMIASMTFMGKVLTLPSVIVNRALGGSSVSYKKIARTFDVPMIQAYFPHVAVAMAAFKEIAWADPIYSIDRLSRIKLAFKCQRIIRIRHDSTILGIVIKSVKIVLEKIKRRIFG